MLNLQQTIFYLQYLAKAKTRHGVHSPFVYRLVDTVIYDFQAKTVYQEIEQLRNKLLKDKRSVKSSRIDQLIYRLVAYLKPRNIIEFGSFFGISTAYLARAAPNSRIISLEEYPETAAIITENLKELNINHVEIVAGSFDRLLSESLKEFEELDFVYFNGLHTKEALIKYFVQCLPNLSENAVMIFNDIYRNKEMKEAWGEIKSSPKVSVSIDLFWFGLVFVRKAQVKEDFMIRF